MENFITSIKIEKVRHLQNIKIELSSHERKHLFLTGRNGSGKTSVLESLKYYLSMYTGSNSANGFILKENVRHYSKLNEDIKNGYIKVTDENSLKINKTLEQLKQDYSQFYKGLSCVFNNNYDEDIVRQIQNGMFVVAYFAAKRKFKAEIPKHIEKIELKTNYSIDETPKSNLVKYLLDLKTTEAFAEKAGKKELSSKIEFWFKEFENLLQDIFDDAHLKLDFDIETFDFNILQSGKEPFNFNELSDGYAAILDIVVDIMLRMEKQKLKFYDIQGVILIDEIETHLHIKLQKQIMPMLTRIFPRIQFIVTTHSPFILNSIENAVIYDLEKQERIENIYGYSYEGIVEYYFNEDMYSSEVKIKFDSYKKLINKKDRTEEEGDLLVEAITYLKQIPPLAAPELVYEFRNLEMKRRGGLDGQN